MSILIDDGSRVLVQGITGREGQFHTERMIRYGTRVVGGVTPGRGGQPTLGVPVFDSVRQAVRGTGADVSVAFVPAALAADAACEASEAGIRLVVVIAEHVPVLDMVRVKAFFRERGTLLVGPNCPGIISPGKCKVGIMPGYIHRPGGVGLVSRSGTLTYEAVHQLTTTGLGQSSCVGIGGDPVHGLSFVDLLKLYGDDPETEAVCLIGEIGGNAEECAAAYIRSTRYPKPVFGFIAGLSAPPGKRMGHAEAIISGTSGRGEDKVAAFEAAGITVIRELGSFGDTVAHILQCSHLSGTQPITASSVSGVAASAVTPHRSGAEGNRCRGFRQPRRLSQWPWRKAFVFRSGPGTERFRLFLQISVLRHF